MPESRYDKRHDQPATQHILGGEEFIAAGTGQNGTIFRTAVVARVNGIAVLIEIAHGILSGWRLIFHYLRTPLARDVFQQNE